jgi:hypothetical protein
MSTQDTATVLAFRTAYRLARIEQKCDQILTKVSASSTDTPKGFLSRSRELVRQTYQLVQDVRSARPLLSAIFAGLALAWQWIWPLLKRLLAFVFG